MREQIIERHGAKMKLVPSAAGAIVNCYQKYTDQVVLTVAILDTMALLGFEVIEMPASDDWKRRLQIYERLGHVDLTDYDQENDVDMQYLFIRYIFIAPDDIKAIGGAAGMDKTDIDKVVNLL